MESEKLVSKDCDIPPESSLPMCLRGLSADTNTGFAPVSTTKSPDAEKQTSKILPGLLHHQMNCQQSSHSGPKGPGTYGPCLWLLDTQKEKVLSLMGGSLFDSNGRSHVHKAGVTLLIRLILLGLGRCLTVDQTIWQ